MKKCNHLPPKEIYDVLHNAEAEGIILPQSVEDWWEEETEMNKEKKCEVCKQENIKKKMLSHPISKKT